MRASVTRVGFRVASTQEEPLTEVKEEVAGEIVAAIAAQKFAARRDDN